MSLTTAVRAVKFDTQNTSPSLVMQFAEKLDKFDSVTVDFEARVTALVNENAQLSAQVTRLVERLTIAEAKLTEQTSDVAGLVWRSVGQLIVDAKAKK